METSDDLGLKEIAKWFNVFVKERFHGEKKHIFDKYSALLQKYAQQTQTRENRATLFLKVKALFAGHEDLIRKFSYFIRYSDQTNANRDRSPSVESKIGVDKDHQRSGLDKQSRKNEVQTSLDYINRVERILKNENKFQQFLDIIIGFGRHKQVQRVEKEALELFKDQDPALRKGIELSDFIAEAAQERKRRREFKFRELNEREEKLLKRESDWHIRDVSFHTMFSAKAAAERLVMENLGRNPEEEINVGNYFSVLDWSCMKKELRGQKLQLLDERLVRREQAIAESKDIVRCLEKKIEKLTSDWSPRKKTIATESHEKSAC